MLIKWAFAISVPFALVVACSSQDGGGFTDNGSGNNGGGSGDDGGSGYFSNTGNGNLGGPFTGDAYSGPQGSSGPCKGGFYGGSFLGGYSSYLTAVGVPIPVTGDVRLTLNQAGAAGQQCQLDGEFTDCSTVFTLQNGTIQGTADLLFGYYCTMTGTLDCNKKTLVDGWIKCTYCTGPMLGDGGPGGTPICPAIAGEFAGPLTASYDTNKLAFVNGTWNGAEALCPKNASGQPVCINYGQPGPDGGPASNFIQDSGVYVGSYGGSGTWNATYGADM
jgi:hypothetical protein